MKWNYRMTRQTGSWGTAYEIREIYYDEAGKPNGCSDSVGPFGESEEELALCLAQMASAIGQPVLDLDTGDWIKAPTADQRLLDEVRDLRGQLQQDMKTLPKSGL